MDIERNILNLETTLNVSFGQRFTNILYKYCFVRKVISVLQYDKKS